MKRAAKWLGIGVGGLLAVVLLLTSGFYTRGRLVSAAQVEAPGTPVAAAALDDPAVLARGGHVGQHIAQCTGCHYPDLGGGDFIDAPAFAVLPAPNLTSGAGGVGAAYGPDELERAIRHGVAADGRGLFVMPSHHYQHMSDADVAALIAWVRTRPPIDREVGERKLGPIGGILTGLGQLATAPGMIDHESVGGAAPAEGPTAEYGAYLAAIGACADCHGEGLAGGKASGNGPPPGPALTPASGGAGSWTLEQFRHALREGETPDGSRLDAEHMPWPMYGRMTDVELEAIWRHLQSRA